MQKIGIVGLGIMGRGMASNFLKHGYELYVWNRTETMAQFLVDRGAKACATPAEVARKADIIFEVTANDESSQSVWTSKTGILAGATAEKTFIICATVSIEWMDKLTQLCQQRKLTFLDMAMTGGRIGAEAGALTLLCGGDEEVLEKLRPTLAAVAQKVIRFGPVGHGMRYKLILNFLQAVHVIGLGQALKIAKAHDMDLKKVGDSLADRPGGVITNLAWRDYQVEPSPINFSIEWITKDLTYAKKLAKDLNVSLLDKALVEYQKAMAKGLAKKDWASINTLLSDE